MIFSFCAESANFRSRWKSGHDCTAPHCSLCKIFSTDAGQLLTDRFFLQDKISICRTEGIFVVKIFLLFAKFTGHLSDKLKLFARQNNNLPVLSKCPAVFSQTVIAQCFSFSSFTTWCWKGCKTINIISSGKVLFYLPKITDIFITETLQISTHNTVSA